MIFRPNFSINNSLFSSNFGSLKEFKPLILLSLACFFYGISAGINDSSFSLFLNKFNLSPQDISYILSCEIIGNIAITPFMLFLISRFGVYPLLIFAILVRNSALAIFGLSDNLPIWYLSMFVFGIGGFILYVGIFQWINTLAPNNVRATFLSCASVAFGLGIAMGPFLITLLQISIGHMTFIISLAICSFMIFPLISAKKYKPHTYIFHPIKINKLFKYASIPIMVAIATEYVYFALAEFLPLYFLGQGKLQYEAYLYASYFTVSGLILSIPIGIVIDKFNRLQMIMIFSLIIAFFIQVLPFVINEMALCLIIFCLLSASINGTIISGLAILGDMFKGNDFVAANSTVHAMSTIGGFAGITTTGLAMDKLGDKGLIFSVSTLFLVFLALLLIEAYKYKRKWQKN